MKTRITVLVENNVRGRNLVGEHGLAYLIESGPHRVLFDTGQGPAIQNNVAVWGIDLARLDAIALSHGHYDHTGGLARLPPVRGGVRVFLHPEALGEKYSRHSDGTAHDIGMPEGAREALRRPGVEVVLSRQPTRLVDGVWLTGEIPRLTPYEDVGGAFYTDADCTCPDPLLDDQSLVIPTGQGAVVLLGCAHAGVVNILQHVMATMGEKRILALIGGMHLLHATEERLKATLDFLDASGVQWVAPCHCTGSGATLALRQHLGARFRDCQVGSVYAFDEAGADKR